MIRNYNSTSNTFLPVTKTLNGAFGKQPMCDAVAAFFETHSDGHMSPVWKSHTLFKRHLKCLIEKHNKNVDVIVLMDHLSLMGLRA